MSARDWTAAGLPAPDDDERIRAEYGAEAAEAWEAAQEALAAEVAANEARRRGTSTNRARRAETAAEQGVSGEGSGGAARRLRVTPLSEITPRAVAWAWDGWLPLGSLSLLAAHPGTGKSTLACWLAARVSRGELEGELEGEPRAVLLASLEDSPSHRLAPMLYAAGADPARVRLVDVGTDDGGRLDVERDLRELAALTDELGAALVVIDPLVAAFSPDVDSHRYSQTTAVLAPLAALARDHDCAVLGAIHYQKAATDPLLGVLGSVAFGGSARSLLVLGRPGDDEPRSRRVLAHAKCSVGSLHDSVECQITPRWLDEDADGRRIATSRIELGGRSKLTADDLIGPPGARRGERTREAEAFLARELAAGPVRSAELHERARAQGIAPRTLERARDALGAESSQHPDGWRVGLPGGQTATSDGGLPEQRFQAGASDDGAAAHEDAMVALALDTFDATELSAEPNSGGGGAFGLRPEATP